jgi:hypothetical protein
MNLPAGCPGIVLLFDEFQLLHQDFAEKKELCAQLKDLLDDTRSKNAIYSVLAFGTYSLLSLVEGMST